MNNCNHGNKLHFAGNGSCSAGSIHWCPDCGAISVVSQWNKNFPNCDWVNYGEEAYKNFVEEKT